MASVDPEGPDDHDSPVFLQTACKNAGFFKCSMMWVSELPVVMILMMLMSFMLLSSELKSCLSPSDSHGRVLEYCHLSIPFNCMNESVSFQV